MARSQPYWRVSPKFWPETAGWTEDARILAIYLLTCQHRTAEGLFVLRLPYIYADLGWNPERLTQPLAELIEQRFIEHDPDRSVFLIVNALKYQAPANPNGVTHALNHLAPVPLDSPLTCSFKRLAQQLCEPLYERLPQRFGQPPAPTPSPAHVLSSEVTETDGPVIHSPREVKSFLKAQKATKRKAG